LAHFFGYIGFFDAKNLGCGSGVDIIAILKSFY